MTVAGEDLVTALIDSISIRLLNHGRLKSAASLQV
jgi:hypothetical protein